MRDRGCSAWLRFRYTIAILMHCLFCSQLPLRRPTDLSNKRLSKKNKTVHRAYGGHLSHAVVRER